MKAKSLDILESAHLPSAQARAILQVMEAEMGTEALATKADLQAMKSELLAMMGDLKEELMARFATKAELAELKAAMFDMKADLMRWMFVFWVGQIAAVFAIVRYLR